MYGYNNILSNICAQVKLLVVHGIISSLSILGSDSTLTYKFDIALNKALYEQSAWISFSMICCVTV